MESNFIQMAASSGHVVAYAIGPIFKHILFFKASIVSSLSWVYVASILLFNFCEQKFVQHGPITIAIDGNGLSVLIFQEKCPNYASGSKSALNSDLFWVRRLFNVCVRNFCALHVLRLISSHTS